MRIGQSEGLSSLIETGFGGFIRSCKYFLGGKNNSRDSVLSQPHGIDSIPPKNCNVITLTERERTVIVGIIDQFNRVTTKAGETRLYSTGESGKEVLFEMYLNADGNCVFNNGEDNAVAFERLKTEFNELKDAFNGLVDDFNSHQHAAPSGGGATTGTQTSSKSNADIDNAKVDKVFFE